MDCQNKNDFAAIERREIHTRNGNSFHRVRLKCSVVVKRRDGNFFLTQNFQDALAGNARAKNYDGLAAEQIF